MKKVNRVTKNNQFFNIIKQGQKYQNRIANIYVLENNLQIDRFGISVSKKIGNAVVRNKIKRQVRTIIDNNKKYYQNKEDYIIIIKDNYLKCNFFELSNKFQEMFEKIYESKEEKK